MMGIGLACAMLTFQADSECLIWHGCKPRHSRNLQGPVVTHLAERWAILQPSSFEVSRVKIFYNTLKVWLERSSHKGYSMPPSKHTRTAFCTTHAQSRMKRDPIDIAYYRYGACQMRVLLESFASRKGVMLLGLGGGSKT